MLVLSRLRDESIIIGDNIVVTVIDIRGDKVRLGIQAPIEIPVHRQEVYEAIQREIMRNKNDSLEKKASGSGGEIIKPQYFKVPIITNNYDVINMGRYGEYVDYLI
ncbi:MAG: carbon storage regulator CsrA [Nanoarchaeota archaeon]